MAELPRFEMILLDTERIERLLLWCQKWQKQIPDEAKREFAEMFEPEPLPPPPEW